MPDALTIRLLRDDDDLDALTDLLHRAYAPLAARGLKYLATHQDVETTRRRASSGVCAVAAQDETVVGTITLYDRGMVQYDDLDPDDGRRWYAKPNVMVFGQFGVDPSAKGVGIGRALHAWAETKARDRGATELACDTAEPATDLVEMYQRWGYRVVGTTQWGITNYRSVILSKTLTDPSAASPTPARTDQSLG